MKQFFKSLGKIALRVLIYSEVSLAINCLLIPRFTGAIEENKRISEFEIAGNAQDFFDEYKEHPFISDTADVNNTVPLQFLLKECGYDIGSCGPDGVFGGLTAKALRQFQEDHAIVVTGEPDKETLVALTNMVLKDPASYKRLENTLICPYQTDRVSKLMQEAPSYLSAFGQPILFLRPDIQLRAAYELFANDLREDPASIALPGCTNNHLRDALRHSESVYRISTRFSYDAAAAAGDYRERNHVSPLPCKLMDIYNHHVAADIAREIHQSDNDSITPTQALVKGIEDGRLMIYPFPLVRKEKVAATN